MKAMSQLVRGRPRETLGTLNPEAGDHPIVTDPRELKAAMRAGERSWQRFPYYQLRYAERGQRFTRSDSAWLASLAERGPTIACEQVTWLGRVLATRGMPRWLLESHLEVLHAELVKAVPAKANIYGALLAAAGMLRSIRHSHVSEALLRAVTIDFADQVGDEWDINCPETGALLAAAVADERAGIEMAVPSLAAWMTDPSRFPPHWIAAVGATLTWARAHAD